MVGEKICSRPFPYWPTGTAYGKVMFLLVLPHRKARGFLAVTKAYENVMFSIASIKQESLWENYVLDPFPIGQRERKRQTSDRKHSRAQKTDSRDSNIRPNTDARNARKRHTPATEISDRKPTHMAQQTESRERNLRPKTDTRQRYPTEHQRTQRKRPTQESEEESDEGGG